MPARAFGAPHTICFMPSTVSTCAHAQLVRIRVRLGGDHLADGEVFQGLAFGSCNLLDLQGRPSACSARISSSVALVAIGGRSARKG
jgi:hypothetical protein